MPCCVCCFFFFKQKTAYEMRISDWSSDVCSSDLIARLGVLFDRARAGQLLGVQGQVMRSPPMLTIPVLMDGSAARTFEARTPWLTAWARFRAGASPIDYHRPTGAGHDALLLSYAQAEGPKHERWAKTNQPY